MKTKSPCQKKIATRTLGKYYEEYAIEYLSTKGYALLTKNFYTVFGEIDLICECEQTIVFVEVRYRKNINYGGPSFSVSYSKQQKLIKTANIYIAKKNLHNYDCRFDVLCLTGIFPNIKKDLIKNAILVN